MSISDPGPPTWREALEGAQLERAKAGDLVRRAKDSLARLAAGDDSIRKEATGVLIKAETEWKHWNGYHAKASRFIAVHPAMERDSIYDKCGHEGVFVGSCYTGPDAGWYAEPAAVPREPEPPASFYEREPGDDDF
jgi:hypothetical protein